VHATREGDAVRTTLWIETRKNIAWKQRLDLVTRSLLAAATTIFELGCKRLDVPGS
jgi:hypothetical protein